LVGYEGSGGVNVWLVRLNGRRGKIALPHERKKKRRVYELINVVEFS